MDQLCAGQRLDRYELLAPLGRGGQGSVWRVRDPLLPEAPRALKLVDIALAGPTQVERLRREARQLAALKHASIVPCHGLFEDLEHGVLGLVVTFVAGQPLSDLQHDPRLTDALGLRVLQHLADALSYLHERGIVHRDVKLENVIVDERFFEDPQAPARARLIDFGIATPSEGQLKLTQLGHIVGTAPYLAPELVDPSFFAAPPDPSRNSRAPRVDVFAFGVLAWRLLLGMHPTGLSEHARLDEFLVAYRRLCKAPDRWLCEAKGRRYEHWLRGCLELNPERRIAKGAALVNAMHASVGSPVPVTLPIEPSELERLSLMDSSPGSDRQPIQTREIRYLDLEPRLGVTDEYVGTPSPLPVVVLPQERVSVPVSPAPLPSEPLPSEPRATSTSPLAVWIGVAVGAGLFLGLVVILVVVVMALQVVQF